MMCCMQGNARRVFERRWDAKGPLGRFAKLGLTPVLWLIIIALLLLFINSVMTCKPSSLCVWKVAYVFKFKYNEHTENGTETNIIQWISHVCFGA